MTFKTLILTAAAFAFVATSVQAQDYRTVVRAQAAISYADLDISRTPGAQALLERIKATAQKLCRPALDANNGSALPYRTCLRTAVENAVLAVDSPLLHSLYGGEPVTVARSE